MKLRSIKVCLNAEERTAVEFDDDECVQMLDLDLAKNFWTIMKDTMKTDTGEVKIIFTGTKEERCELTITGNTTYTGCSRSNFSAALRRVGTADILTRLTETGQLLPDERLVMSKPGPAN